MDFLTVLVCNRRACCGPCVCSQDNSILQGNKTPAQRFRTGVHLVWLTLTRLRAHGPPHLEDQASKRRPRLRDSRGVDALGRQVLVPRAQVEVEGAAHGCRRLARGRSPHRPPHPAGLRAAGAQSHEQRWHRLGPAVKTAQTPQLSLVIQRRLYARVYSTWLQGQPRRPCLRSGHLPPRGEPRHLPPPTIHSTPAPRRRSRICKNTMHST